VCSPRYTASVTLVLVASQNGLIGLRTVIVVDTLPTLGYGRLPYSFV